MGRKRDPRRDQAKQLWLDSNGEKKLKDIADELDVSAPQVRKWKSVDGWSNGNVTKKIKERYQKQKRNTNSVGNNGGAPPGNVNATGNTGGAPNGNKNALVTGEYETISFAYLSDEERQLFEGITDDPLITINTQIRELKIRQYRILGRIKARESGLNDFELNELLELRKQGKTVTNKSGRAVKVPGMVKVQETHQHFRAFDDILKLGNALTAVNNSLLRATHEKQHMIESLSSERRRLLSAEAIKAEAEAAKVEKGSNGLGMQESMHGLTIEELRRLASESATE